MNQWNKGALNEYGIYIIEYYIGYTKNKEKKIVNYVDDLISDNKNTDKEYMFEEFGIIEPLIVKEKNIIRWIKIDIDNY